MKEILFATGNKSKLEQFQFVADSYGFDVRVVSVYEKFSHVAPYSEEYNSQEKIVEKGCKEISEQIKTPVLVEDTILEVDALGGLPGLRSNVYLKQHGRQGLLDELQGVSNRTAREISIVGFFDGQVLITFKNIVEGSIASEESFKQGEPHWVGPTTHPFGGGYNAVFISKETNKTIADLTKEEGLKYGYREPNFSRVLQYQARQSLGIGIKMTIK